MLGYVLEVIHVGCNYFCCVVFDVPAGAACGAGGSHSSGFVWSLFAVD